MSTVLESIENAKPVTCNEQAATESKEDITQTIQELAELDPIEYDKRREEAARLLGVRVSTLDKEVKKEREKHTKQDADEDELTQGVTPWDEEVNGKILLDEVKNILNRYCSLPTGSDIALSLWLLSSYAINGFRIFPKICLSSPEKRCGKTTTLEVMGAIANRALMTSNVTPSVLFRSIEAWQPTLLIDEADTFIHGNDELRGVVNSGHTRSGAFVLRTEGESGDRQPVKFSTWTPMVIAMIKTPPDTIVDRSVMVKMRRKMPGESIEKLPYDLTDNIKALRQQCKRWADDNTDSLTAKASILNDIPALNNDRAMDNWRPLLTVADMVGGDWPIKAREAMIHLEQTDGEESCIGSMILKDIQEIFASRNTDKISSEALVKELVEMEERPWCEWKHGSPMTKNSLSKILKDFGIRPGTIRVGLKTPKGYYLKSFKDTFARYLPENPIQTATTTQPSNHAGFSGFQNDTQTSAVALSNPLKASNNKACGVVAVPEGGSEDRGDNKRFIL